MKTNLKTRVSIVVLSSLLFAMAGGCVSRKDRVTTSTLDINIDPSSTIVLPRNGQTSLRIVARSAKSDSVDVNPTWVAENGIGSFNPPVGKSTVFTAGNSSQVADIYALYEDKVSRHVKVVVGSYYVYDDAFAADLTAPGAFNGGGASILLRSNTVEKSVGTQSFETLFSMSAGGWAGWFVKSITTKDMSAYAGGYLRFDIKTAHDIEIKIESVGPVGHAEYISSYIVPDNSRFQSVAIPIAAFAAGGVQLSQMQAMFIASAVGGVVGAQTDQTYIIDNIRWTEN